MSDRLETIRAMLDMGDEFLLPGNARWLIAEVERLRAELASLRDHPGGVDPQTGSECVCYRDLDRERCDMPPETWPDGNDIPEYDCTVCGLPSRRASYGGPGICTHCDCGSFRDKTKWTYSDVMLTVATATEAERAEFHRRARTAAESASRVPPIPERRKPECPTA